MGLLPSIISWACRGLDVGLAVRCFFFFFYIDFTSKIFLGFYFWLESRTNHFFFI